MRILILVNVVALLAGCAATAVKPVIPSAIVASPAVSISAKFDSNEAARLIQDGVNTIKGNGFMRQRGGGVVTCAGSSVALVPATAYAKERVLHLYGSDLGGSTQREARFAPDPVEYQSLTKRTTCDSQGNFQFDRVADGEFYVTTKVSWQVARQAQGGYLIKLVKVSGGSFVSVVLSS